MRTIKFRAFQDGKMIYQEQAGVYGARYFLDKCYEDCELMQFTGLLDKNGKEIYESDLVKCSADGGTRKVEWYELGAGWILTGIECATWYNGIAVYPKINLEVIGNIHEQPKTE